MFLSRAQLLQALDWPDPVNVRTGSMTWTRTSGEGRAMRILSASVIVTAGAIACRMRSALVSRPGQLEPHVEAVWKTHANTPPKLSRWVVEGQPKNPQSPTAPEEAISHFRSAVASLGVAPVFTPSPNGTEPGWATP